jgi:two-component system response regulator YesN
VITADRFDAQIHARQSAHKNRSRLAVIARRAVDLIARDYVQAGLNLDVASRELGVTKSHLCRVFKHHVGAGFPQYLRCIRAEHADELLRECALSVKEIAAAVGFDHTAQLDRAMKEVYGCTPTQRRLLALCAFEDADHGARVMRTATAVKKAQPSSTHHG